MSAWTDFRDSVKGEVLQAAEKVGFGSATDAGKTVSDAAPSIFQKLFGAQPNTQGNVSAASTNIVPPAIIESAEKYKMYLYGAAALIVVYMIVKGRK